jgi:site-specific DNA-methyltransferase (adenine-specific)
METESQHNKVSHSELPAPDKAESFVFHEDCMVGLKRFPDGYFDLAICDIPYGIGVGNMAYLKEVSTTVRQKNGTRMNGNKNKKPYTQKQWDSEPPTQEYFDELKRVSKEQIIFGIEYVNWEGVGAGRIRWNKGVAEGMSFKKYEVAYCSMIDTEIELPLLWAGMCQAKSLIEPMTQQGNKKLNEKRVHPCHKPILLYQKFIKDYGWEGMKVLDTHVGGMSSVIACLDAGISITAFEIDLEYFLKGKKRIEDFLGQENIFKERPIISFVFQEP